MDGRFPFDANGGRRVNQISAQMRAALGLSGAPGLDDAYYLQQVAAQQQAQQQQQRQQELQRDIQLRQLLLQEQLEQHLQEQQLRAIGDQLQDFPDLQQQYQTMLLSEQLNRRPSTNGNGPAQATVAAQQQQQQQQQHAALLRERSLRAYEEQMRLQQHQQQLTLNGFRPEEMARPNQSQSTASLLISAAAAAQQQAQDQAKQQVQHEAALRLNSPHLHSRNMSGSMDASSIASPSGPTGVLPSPATLTSSAPPDHGRSFDSMDVDADLDAPTGSPLQQGLKRSQENLSKEKVKKKTRKKASKTPRKKNTNKKGARFTPSPESLPLQDQMDLGRSGCRIEGVFDTFALAADMVEPALITKGTISDLLNAATESETMDTAASILMSSKSMEAEPWSDDESEYIAHSSGLVSPKCAGITVSTPLFRSSLPSLPQEPFPTASEYRKPPYTSTKTKFASQTGFNKALESNLPVAKEAETKSEKTPSVLDLPYPIDTWWPSTNGMKRERKQSGETSDEDNFEDGATLSGEVTPFRANEAKIRKRLSQSLHPGVLEKLPHCKIHRIRSSQMKNCSAPELVYCWQVTEVYPQETMLDCSRCGTWRHAACGGHHKPYVKRDQTKTPFVALCENCHEEDKFLKDYPVGEKRVERQRMEQLRRGLATASVMRHSSYSKHGGTYKWPLGSVSATHIGGHTRSVHSRHDKAEKQWSDMSTRLGRGLGYRQKERVRSRTKELERLLIAVEDAEGYTDRHNMFLFLNRDTAKEKPAGFEKEQRNLFDPADDVSDPDDETMSAATAAKSIMPFEGSLDAKATLCVCARSQCKKLQRFDSQFCSDACGIICLELDLLRTLQDASDIHPSVLRL